MLYPLKLTAEFKPRLWGSRKLADLFGFALPPDQLIGEAWLIADHPAGMSRVANGFLAGLTLNQVLVHFPRALLGMDSKLTRFPLLIKLLATEANLSVQVHPDDIYAAVHEQDGGKSELWYIIAAAPGTEIIYGLKPGLTPARFQQAIKENAIESCLNKVKVKQGDVFYVPPGLVHALGSNIVAAEVQQSSDLTYRIYDYNRLDRNGQLRELSIDKALEVIKWDLQPTPTSLKQGFECDKFKVNLLYLRGPAVIPNPQMCTFLVLEGTGQFTGEAESVTVCAGDALVIPAANQELLVEGNLVVLSSCLSR